MKLDSIALSVFFFDKGCKVTPLKIDGGTLQNQNSPYFSSLLTEIRNVLKAFPEVYLSTKIPAPYPTNQIYLLLADPQLNLSNPITLQNLADQKPLRWVSVDHPRVPGALKTIQSLSYAPVITIGYEDIMFTYSQPREMEEQDLEKKRIRDYNMDTRFKFLDSSIWHRYVPSYSENQYIFKQRFSEVLQEIIQYYKDQLYHTNAARAMLEFQLRMMRESYIFPVGERNHSKAVTPFKFHSETQMKEMAEHLMKDYFIGNNLHESVKWRFLLIDDYANTGISSDNHRQIALSKRALIEQLLEGLEIDSIEYPEAYGENDSEAASKDIVSKCLDKLQGEKRYDILLLDYLLGGISGKEEEREYGFEFLQLLQLDSQGDAPKYKRGPFMRHWIFPISSFPFALYDKMRQLGIDNYFHLWHLSGGGDPITTPHLFRYYLLNFMKQQVEEVFLGDETLARYLSIYSHESDPITWAEIIEKRLGNIKSKILIIDGIESTSKFAESVSGLMENGYREFIDKLKDLIGALYKGLDQNIEYENFKKNWELLKIDYSVPDQGSKTASSFSKTISLIEGKLKSTIFQPLEKAKARIQAFDKGRLNLSGLNLLEFPIHLIPDEKREKITNLDLKNNRIAAIPKSIKTLKSLSKLNLEGNRLSSLITELTELNLDHLNIKSNRFEEWKVPLIAKSKHEVTALLDIALKKARENSTLTQLKVLIRDGKLDTAFKEAREKLTVDPNWENDFDLLESRLNDIEQENDLGKIGRDTYKTERTQIKYALLGLLSDFEK